MILTHDFYVYSVHNPHHPPHHHRQKLNQHSWLYFLISFLADNTVLLQFISWLLLTILIIFITAKYTLIFLIKTPTFDYLWQVECCDCVGVRLYSGSNNVVHLSPPMHPQTLLRVARIASWWRPSISRHRIRFSLSFLSEVYSFIIVRHHTHCGNASCAKTAWGDANRLTFPSFTLARFWRSCMPISMRQRSECVLSVVYCTLLGLERTTK